MTEVKKRMKKEEREKQILEAAGKVFSNKGYKGATTLEIAQEADISEVTLFRYFTSKQEIFMGVIQPILTESLEKAIQDSNELSNKERLKFILKDRIRFVIKNNDLVKLVLMESQLHNDLPSINVVEHITQVIRQMIHKMIDIPDRNKEFITRAFMGVVLSFLFMPEANEEQVDFFIDELLTKIMNN